MDRCQWELFEYLNRWPYGAALGWLCDFVHQPCGKSEKAGGHYVLCIEMEPDSAWPRKRFGCWCALSHCTWCNGFGAMITSDSSILIPFERLPLGFADIPRRLQPWSAKVRVFWQTKHWWHSCILNFTTSLSSFFVFFCHMLSLLRKGKHFRMWAIQASLCLLEPYGQLCFTCSPGQGRWFVRWRDLSINSLDQRSQHWLLEITYFFHWMIMITIYMIYDSLVIV